jgi:hypothetical protein
MQLIPLFQLDSWIKIALVPKWNSWFTCQVIETRHTYELCRKDGGPKCKNNLELELTILFKR